jgi:hypothetical protein
MLTSPTKTEQVDAAAILSTIWVKNDLRRGSGLPLWPVRETFERELKAARWRIHCDANYEDTREQILAELRARHGEGFGGSVTGRWVIEILTSQALRASFGPT